MGSESYFDNNATTRLSAEALEAMQPYLMELYGNPSSIHSFGSQVGRKIQEAREQVAALLGASDPIEIVFTSCGTEGDNAAIRGLLESRPGKNHIVTTQVEHPAILGLCQHLEKKGYRVTWLSVDSNGMLDLGELRDSLSDDTALVSIMTANNETGVIFPVDDVGKMVRAKGIPFHVDAVQAAGKIPLNLKNSPIDLLTISGHKFHGPKGIGALYIRRGITFRPLIIGGHQERNRRSGTENVSGIVGMGKAAELALRDLGKEQERVRCLRDRLEKSLLVAGCRVNGHREKRLPNTLNVSFEFLEGEAILVLLDEYGICASTGSACTAGSVEPSHVLRAMRVPSNWLQGAVRFSLSHYNTEEEVDFVSEKMPGIVQRLQGLSVLGKVSDRQGVGEWTP
ncbi:MAG: cysteine desulfurase NifS [Deltaproteobacteria bacterium]|nr:cysteine desulfurase NifS [Deltaproteobacteria bacterium]MCZ6450133.1 cysteine desulfurase NifS [Deltaproteobacteria bacterium]MCZ6547880.1 cysteine desulfurase NifS [Deltaproteobacteria bacterium]MCZ6562336.1 cysteine desulfurase NifS [Deltaproteobacteria bacterium]MCZ6620322.1 cysteine desulfurase NifS [Deltaproteobacteria bacterium]